jgi:hypothetical protein
MRLQLNSDAQDLKRRAGELRRALMHREDSTFQNRRAFKRIVEQDFNLSFAGAPTNPVEEGHLALVSARKKKGASFEAPFQKSFATEVTNTAANKSRAFIVFRSSVQLTGVSRLHL